MTLDESWVEYKPNSYRSDHYYVKRKEKIDEKKIKFSAPINASKFMIIVAMSYDRTFPLIKVPEKTTVNAEYYREMVLKPLINIHIKKHFKSDISKVIIHHDKSPVHTSKLVAEYLKKMNEKYGIRILSNDEIPVKGPDITPIDFFGNSLIKQRIYKMKSKSLADLWKNARSVWRKVTTQECHDAYESWKRRCRAVSQKNGGHIEQIKGIHSHKTKI